MYGHVALQELWVVVLMLCELAVHLPGKVVALHLYYSNSKACMCNQGNRVSLFLSRMPHFEIAWPEWYDFHSSLQTNTSQYRSSLFFISGDWFLNDLFLCRWNSISTFDSTGCKFVGILRYQSMSAVLCTGVSVTTGNLGFEYFQQYVELSG